MPPATVLTVFQVAAHTAAGWVQLGVVVTADTRPLVSFAGPQISAYARSDGNSYRSPIASSSATANQLRPTITDPCSTTPDIARVYEVTAH